MISNSKNSNYGCTGKPRRLSLGKARACLRYMYRGLKTMQNYGPEGEKYELRMHGEIPETVFGENERLSALH